MEVSPGYLQGKSTLGPFIHSWINATPALVEKDDLKERVIVAQYTISSHMRWLEYRPYVRRDSVIHSFSIASYLFKSAALYTGQLLMNFLAFLAVKWHWRRLPGEKNLPSQGVMMFANVLYFCLKAWMSGKDETRWQRSWSRHFDLPSKMAQLLEDNHCYDTSLTAPLLVIITLTPNRHVATPLSLIWSFQWRRHQKLILFKGVGCKQCHPLTELQKAVEKWRERSNHIVVTRTAGGGNLSPCISAQTSSSRRKGHIFCCHLDTNPFFPIYFNMKHLAPSVRHRDFRLTLISS